MAAPMDARGGAVPPTRTMTGGRVALVAVGSVVVLIGLAMMIGGGVLVWMHTTQRDAGGFYNTTRERFTTPTAALTSQLDLGDIPSDQDWTPFNPLGTVRIRATGTAAAPVFIGIGPQDDVDRWLAGVAHEHVTSVNFGPFDSETEAVPGDLAATPPGTQRFWAASTAGTGEQTLLWKSEHGQWTIVVMNADARPGVTTSVVVGMKTGIFLPIGIGVGSFGVLLLVGGVLMMFFAIRKTSAGAIAAPGTVARDPSAYPARLDGHLDQPLNRWLWLVKWILVIPHAIVLGFLWLAVFELTIVAWFAILFAGRYPRSIFEFNAGVMRWTWRVSFYAFGALGTDRYPPFTVARDFTYPADFEVDYPARLSRGLVLVKSWLLALPHLVIVAVFAGGWGFGWRGPWTFMGGGGLILLLVAVAGVVLLVKNRYPESLFDFVMGLERWCYRVLAYTALMRDEYPPFRLDSGGTDPGSVPIAPPPAAPQQPGELVRTGD